METGRLRKIYIRRQLQEVYERKFSYGTVVQLCVARNKRRYSAKITKVWQSYYKTSTKGVYSNFNPDSHWSAALYKDLNWLETTDGSDIININRDDTSGFRLDTMVTRSAS